MAVIPNLCIEMDGNALKKTETKDWNVFLDTSGTPLQCLIPLNTIQNVRLQSHVTEDKTIWWLWWHTVMGSSMFSRSPWASALQQWSIHHVAVGCTNAEGSGKNVFGFPKDKETRDRWIGKAIGRECGSTQDENSNDFSLCKRDFNA